MWLTLAFTSLDLKEIEDTLSDGSCLLENLEEILGDNQNILVFKNSSFLLNFYNFKRI